MWRICAIMLFRLCYCVKIDSAQIRFAQCTAAYLRKCGGFIPWNPDFRYLLTGIVMADLAKFSSPSLTKDFLRVAAKQIEVAARGIVNEINCFAEKLE